MISRLESVDSGQRIANSSIEQSLTNQGHNVQERAREKDSTGNSFPRSSDGTNSRFSSYNSIDQGTMNSLINHLNIPRFDHVCADADDEMASREKRLETYKLWPASPINPTELVSAGFYYTGPGDNVRCYSCDLQLRNWVQGDKPMEEHRRLKPGCNFIIESEREGYGITCHGEPVSSEAVTPFRQPITNPHPELNSQYNYGGVGTSYNDYVTMESEPMLPYQSAYNPNTNPLLLDRQRALDEQVQYTKLQTESNARLNLLRQNQTYFQQPQSLAYSTQNFHQLDQRQGRVQQGPPYSGQDQPSPSSISPGPYYPQRNQPYLQTPAEFQQSGANPVISRPRVPIPSKPYNSRSEYRELPPISQERAYQEPRPRRPVTNLDMIPVRNPMPRPSLLVRAEDVHHVTSPTDLQSEHHRLTTFVDWPDDCPVRPWELASAGFYYLGNGDNVKCFRCNVALRNWDPQDTPWEEHKRWSPDCPLVMAHAQGKHTVRPVEDQEPVQQRHAPYTQYHGQYQESLSYQEPAQQRLPFSSSVREQAHPKPFTDPSPVQQRKTYSPQGSEVCYSNQLPQRYENTETRNTLQQPSERSFDAGFAQPFGHIKGNERAIQHEERNAFTHKVPEETVHQPVAPSTPFISMAETNTIMTPSENLLSNVSSVEHGSQDGFSCSDVMKVVEMGFSQEAIDEAIAKKTQRTGTGFTKLDELLQALLDDNQNTVTPTPQPMLCSSGSSPNPESQGQVQDFTNLRNFNNREELQVHFASNPSYSYEQRDKSTAATHQVLKRSNSAPPGSANPGTPNEAVLRGLERMQEERLICKICMDAEVGMVFLPCGHISCCLSCASGMDLCPMCRKPIQDAIRTFLS